MDSDKAAAGTADVEPAGSLAQVSTDEPDDREREPGDDRTDSASEDSAGGHRTAGRVLKLVLTLKPADGAGYHALLAVGSDDCDPLMRSVEGVDLSGALQEVASLAAEAEVRWQTLPRNPASVKKSSGSPRRPGPKQPEPEDQPQETAAQSEDSERAQTGQLELFG